MVRSGFREDADEAAGCAACGRGRPPWRVVGLWAFAAMLMLPVAVPAAAQDSPEPARSVNVTVRGVDGVLRDNVLAHLGIAELEPRGLLARLDPRRPAEPIVPEEVERRHRAAPREIRAALMPYGHYLPEIEAELRLNNGRYEARYTIDPGPVARVRGVELRLEGEGAEEPAILRALDAVRLRAGDRLIHANYEAAREAMFDAAYNRGYLAARWRAREILVAPHRLTADIRLVLDTGPRYYFGDVAIHAERLNQDFVARFGDIHPGDPYDLRRLLALQLQLNDTEYFSNVEIRADPAEADAENRIPVSVLTEPAPQRRYTAGLGYATDTGPRFNFGLLLRRVNPRGHRLHSELQLSQLETALAGRYVIPIRNVAHDLFDISATARQLEVGDAESTQYAAGVSQYVGWRGFRRRAYMQLQREEFQFGEQPTEATKLFYPGLTLTRETGNDMLYPTSGYSLHLDLRGGADGAFSDVTFARLRGDLRWVRGLTERSRLLVRAEAGVIRTSDFDALPPTQRFFAGGDRSVRGYEYQTLGERNAAGDVIGGRYLLLGSVEAERLVLGDFGAAVFVDAGDAFNRSFRAHVGAGLGVRWRSPVGMVRLDLAHPFQHDDAVRVHLSIGADL